MPPFTAWHTCLECYQPQANSRLHCYDAERTVYVAPLLLGVLLVKCLYLAAEMLQDLIVAAVNEAVRDLDEKVEKHMAAVPGVGGLGGMMGF